MNTIGIKAPADFVKTFLLDPYRVLRLNPSWYIRDIKAEDTGAYVITLYDDRSDETSQMTLKIELQWTINPLQHEFRDDGICCR